MDWRNNARCLEVGTEAFFPDPTDLIGVKAAKDVCGRCYVQAECLETGINEVYGIWGGTTDAERRQIRSNRRKAIA
jgi:WhiB family redox-sensing transcriptional regulator